LRVGSLDDGSPLKKGKGGDRSPPFPFGPRMGLEAFQTSLWRVLVGLTVANWLDLMGCLRSWPPKVCLSRPHRRVPWTQGPIPT
jgi:hypothetical protein